MYPDKAACDGSTRFGLLVTGATMAAILLPVLMPAQEKALSIAGGPPALKIIRSFVIQPDFVEQGITRAANGDLLIPTAEKRPPQPSDSRLFRSADGGQTWTPSAYLSMTSAKYGVPILSASGSGITTLKDGTILWPLQVQKINQRFTDRECELYVLRSADHGHSWTRREPVHTGLRETWSYGRIVELPDGTLLLPVWGMRVLGERWRSGLLKSHDGGRTWGDHRTIAWDPYAGGREDNGFNETTLALLPSGELLAIVRQQQVGHYPDERPEKYSEPPQELYRTFSRDGGDTWALPQRLALRGTSPAVHVTARGTLLLGTRDTQQGADDHASRGIAVRVSRDKGVTWEQELQLVDPEPGPDYRFKPGDVGYPAFQNLPDGRVLVVFYSHLRRGQERTSRIRTIGNVLKEIPAP